MSYYGKLNLTPKQFANHFCNTMWFNSTGESKILEDLLYWIERGDFIPASSQTVDDKKEYRIHYWQIYEFEALRRIRSRVIDRENPKHTIPYPDLKLGNRFHLNYQYFIEQHDKFDLLGRYVSLLYYGNKETAEQEVQSISKDIHTEDDEPLRELLLNLCMQWRDYFDHKLVGIRNHLYKDIDMLVYLLVGRFGHTEESLKTEIDRKASPSSRLFFDSLYDWVFGGDIYAQTAKSKLILFTKRSLAKRLVLDGNELTTDDVTQICEYVIKNDQILLLHSLSWMLDSDNPDLGKGYYYTEAIRNLRESAISIETMLVDLALKKGKELRGTLNPKLNQCFGQSDKPEWWDEFESYNKILGGTETTEDIQRFLGKIQKLDHKQLTIGQAFAIVAKIRNISSHTAKHSRDLFDAAFGLCEESIIAVIFYLWFWGKAKKDSFSNTHVRFPRRKRISGTHLRKPRRRRFPVTQGRGNRQKA